MTLSVTIHVDIPTVKSCADQEVLFILTFPNGIQECMEGMSLQIWETKLKKRSKPCTVYKIKSFSLCDTLIISLVLVL